MAPAQGGESRCPSRWLTDTASGAKAERVGLAEAIAYAREGDVLTALAERKVGFKSITENIDTTTSGGKLIFHIFGALAEFERDIIRERTQAGLSAARARGRKGGRPKALTPKKAQMAVSLYNDKTNSIADICRTLNVSRATLYGHLRAANPTS